jgi:hypothetical protein
MRGNLHQVRMTNNAPASARVTRCKFLDIVCPSFRKLEMNCSPVLRNVSLCPIVFSDRRHRLFSMRVAGIAAGRHLYASRRP